MSKEVEQLDEFLPSPMVGDKLAIEERAITEVDNLFAARIAPGEFDKRVLEDVRQNLVTAVQEAAMPYAVTTTRHEIEYDQETQQRTFRWLGKTAIQTAMSGYRYHHHPSAVRRVDVEVDEARYASEALRPEIAQVFISPRMSRKDASLEDARREHLGDDDAVRVSWIDEKAGKPERVLQSLLVRDVPLSAWTRMLADPGNIFGKSIQIEDEASALSVMKVHRQLEVDLGKLPRGPITILEEVAKYIENRETRESVMKQIERYYDDQELMRQQAEFKAGRWLEFECELAESMATGRPTSAIKSFIATMQTAWNNEELRIIDQHAFGHDLEYIMTRELAVVLEKAKQNILWGGTAVLHGNEAVTKQLSVQVRDQIVQNEQQILMAYQSGIDFRALESNSTILIGAANIKVGGGCAGSSDRSSDSTDPNNPLSLLELGQGNENQQATDSWESNPNSRKWKKGVCQVQSCATRPGQTEVGPCSVCKSCQAKFDKGQDPTKEKTAAHAHKTPRIEEQMNEIFANTDVRRDDREKINIPTSQEVGELALAGV